MVLISCFTSRLVGLVFVYGSEKAFFLFVCYWWKILVVSKLFCLCCSFVGAVTLQTVTEGIIANGLNGKKNKNTEVCDYGSITT